MFEAQVTALGLQGADGLKVPCIDELEGFVCIFGAIPMLIVGLFSGGREYSYCSWPGRLGI